MDSKSTTPAGRFAPGRLGWALLLACPVVVLLFALDELWRYHPAQHFFPLALATGLLLILRRLREPGPLTGGFGTSPWLMAGHLALALTAFLFDSPVLGGLAVLAAALAFDVALWNLREGARPNFYVSLLSLFLIPPPLALDEKFRQTLAAWATKLSQVWLDDMGLLNLVEGSIVVTAEKRFFVNDACSGINSLLVALCLAVIVCAFRSRRVLHLVLLLTATTVMAVGSNVLRILVVIHGSAVLGIGLDKGVPHDLVGGASFLLDLLLVWCADRGLTALLGENAAPAISTVQQQPSPVPARATPSPLRLGWLGGGSVAVACAGVALVFVPQLVLRKAEAAPVSMQQAQEQEFVLPERLGDWQRQGDKPLENAMIGDLSVRNVVWLYRRGGLEACVALNFPFVGMHDTRLCYLGQGWKLEAQEDCPQPGDAAPCVRRVSLFHPVEHTHASLWLTVFDQNGRALPWPSQAAGRFSDRLFQRWRQAPAPALTYTLQILVPASAGEPASAEVEKLLTDVRQHVAGLLSHSPASPPSQTQASAF